MKRNVLVVLALLSVGNLVAQNTIETAKKLFKKGDYNSASVYFEKLDSTLYYESDAVKMIAQCNAKLDNYKRAEYWAAKLIRQAKPSAENYGLYFEALVNEGKYCQAFDFAMEYKKLGFTGTPIDRLNPKRGDFWKVHALDSSLNKVLLLPINSAGSELAPTILDDQLYFTVNRAKDPAAKDDPQRTTHIFRADILADSTVSITRNLYEEFVGEKCEYVNFSQDGRIVFCNKISTRNNGKKLYWGHLVGDTPQKLMRFPYNNKDYSIGRATISPDGKRMVFSSDMPGSMGQIDLWMSKFENGKWSKPQNLGDSINTKKNEAMPYFISNTKLCFASEGHMGYGRFDLFVTECKGDRFSAPVNMGSPVNSRFSEIGICYSKKTDQFFFASNRRGNYDIYLYRQNTKKSVSPATATNKPKQKDDYVPNQSAKSDPTIKVDHLEIIQSDKQVDKKVLKVHDSSVTETPGYFYSVQLMALTPKVYARQQFKEELPKDCEYFVVNENNMVKIRTGHFVSYQSALEYVKRLKIKQYYIFRMP